MSDKDTATVQDKTKKTNDLNLYQKLAAITGDLGAIAKGGTNREQSYSFIEYGAVAGKLRELFAIYNVMCIPKMGARTETEVTTKSGSKGYHVLIEFTFTFVNGDKPDEREEIPWIGEATDYGDKATNKAATGALKYCLMRTFNVSEKGDDPDGTTPEAHTESAEPRTMSTKPTGLGRNADKEPATPNQKALIARKLGEQGVTKEDMQGYLIEQYGITDPENMTKKDASSVIDMLMGE